MTDRQVATLRAVTEALWTLTVVGIIAYAGRTNIRSWISRKRAEIDARTAAVRDAETALRSRMSFARHDRERIIAEEFDVLTDDALDRLAEDVQHA